MRYLFLLFLFLFLIASLIYPSTVSAKGGQGKSEDARGKGSKASMAVDANIFGEGEVATIRAWFSNKKNLEGLPPGLAKRERLSEGLERQLKRNGSLPPGLEKHLHSFPLELEHSLRKLPDGVVRVVIGVDIVLLDKTANKILDIVRDIF